VSAFLAPDVAQIQRALESLLQQNAQARVLGMRSPMRRNWPEFVECRSRRFRLAWCASESSLIGVVGCKGILVIRDVIFSRVHILGAGRYRPRCRGRA